MKNIAIFFSAAALLALATPGVARNSQDTAGNTSNQWHQELPWLFTAGPDSRGNYSARISVADLDLSTIAGERTARSRTFRGIARACWLVASDPKIKAGAVMDEGRCINEGVRQSNVQIERVVAEAKNGQKIAFLQLGTPRPQTADN